MRQGMMALLLIAVMFSISATAANVPLIIYNFTNQPGNIFVGSNQGPFIAATGNPFGWQNAPVNGNQLVSLGATGNICYVNGGRVILSSALYTGDTITISFIQPQFPSGISCDCSGSACKTG